MIRGGEQAIGKTNEKKDRKKERKKDYSGLKQREEG